MPSQKREFQEMDLEEGARKRLKTTSTPESMAGPVIEIDTAAEKEAVQPVLQEQQQQHQQTPHDPAALQLLRGDFDDLRQLITCKICERLLYEPYVLSCGHTYCYSCLSTWFTTSKKKTCPMCRDVVAQPPVPSHLIREMTHIFMRRHDLLPDGETVEQHNLWREEEAEIVRKDKEDGGLFKNIFDRRDREVPVHDPVDGVDRCPRCGWEVEDGMCNNCGIHMDQDSDDDSFEGSESDDEDLDGDLDELDADLQHDMDPAFIHGAGFGYPPDDFESFEDSDDGHQLAAEIRRRYEILGPQFLDQMTAGFPDFEESGEEDEDEDEGSLEDFIDDRDDVDITTQTISSQQDHDHAHERRPRYRPRAIVSSPEDSEEDDDNSAPHIYEVNDDSDEDNEDDDDDSDVPRVIGSRPRQTDVPRRGPRRPVVIVDSDEDISSGDDADMDAAAPNHSRTGHVRRAAVEEISDGSSSGSEEDEGTHDDIDSEDEIDGSEDVSFGHYDEGEENSDEDSITNNGFSPMQSTDGEQPETAFHQFDVYGGLSNDDDDDDDDDDNDEGGSDQF